MKAILIFVLGITLVDSVAIAGTPDQDPIVKSIRDRFELARTPTMQDLQLGKTWVCKYYTAMKDSFISDGPTDSFKFSEFDGRIQNDLKLFLISEFSYQNDTLFGFYDRERINFLYLRVAQDGDLLWEVSGPSAVGGSFPHSISNPLHKSGYTYGVCPISKVKL